VTAASVRVGGPIGALTVAGGLAVLGVSSFLVLGMAGHTLEPGAYSAVASLYLLVAILGPGAFSAVEQETNREASRLRAGGNRDEPVVRAGLLAALRLAALVGGLVAAAGPLVVPLMLDGSWALLGCLLLAVGGSAGLAAVRGVLAARGRRGWYGLSLAVEGGSRIAACGAVAAGGATQPVAFGLAFAAGAGVAFLVCLPGLRSPAHQGPTVAVDRGAMTRSAGLLALGSAVTFVLANAAPLVLVARLTDRPGLAASYVSLFVLARAPLFVFAPVQSFLLSGLAAAAERGDAEAFGRRLRHVLVVIGVAGVVGTAGAAAFGPWAARVLMGAPLDLSATAAGLLGLGTAGMVAAQLLQPALVATGAHRSVTGAWMVGGCVFGALLALPLDPVAGAVGAQLVGPVVVGAAMLLALRSTPSDGPTFARRA
jgi:O-antigen/teichoic acid export membrane protein